MSDDASAPAPSTDAGSRMLREGGKLSLLTMVSRVLGLIRQMTMAAFMGTGWLADAFNAAFILPNLLRRLFAENSMTAAFIPTFTGYLSEGDDKETREFLSSTLTVLVFLVGITVALGIAFAPWIVLLFQSENPGEIALLTQIMFPMLALVAVAALFQGILNSIGVFTPSGLGPILFNIFWIGVPYFLGRAVGNPARGMAVGVLLGSVAQALCQLPAVLKAGYSFGFIDLRKAFKNRGMRRVFALVAPTIVGMAAYQINIVVSSALATKAGTGSLSSLNYSLRLQEFVLGVFVISLGTVLLPDLAGSARGKDWETYSASLRRGLRTMLLITVPVSLYAMVVGEDIVTFLYRMREFGAESVARTTRVFFWHMAGIAFIGANRVIPSAFYARGDTKTPTWAGLASVAVNVGLAFALVGPMKAPGIALALSGASAVNTVILVIALIRTRTPGLRGAMADSGRYALRLFGFSVVAAAPVYFLRQMLAARLTGWNANLAAGLSLAATALVFGAIGVALLALSRDETGASIVKAFRRRRSQR
jgi:putative peptidoglycan lipid II flippase